MLNLTTFIEAQFGVVVEVEQLVPANLESIRAISRMVHSAWTPRATP